MSQFAVKVENLGKQYWRGDTNRHNASSLREQLSAWGGSFFRDLSGKKSPPKKVQDFWAVRDLSVEVKEGEIIGVIGRNGAGKTTLLKLLSRITEPTEGRISIRGRLASLLEVGTGFHPDLTGRQNIFLNGVILGMSRKEIKNRFDEIVDFAEVAPFIDTPVKRYSSGMYVRLAFSVAAHLEPDILLVDEVLAVGDALFQKKCLAKMDDVSKRGRTVFFVSHSMGTVRALCDRAILVDKGRLALDGKCDTVINHYLEMGNDKSPTITFAPDPQKEVQIMGARLLNAGQTPSCNLDMLQPFTLEVEYDVRNPVKGVVVGAAVTTSMQESLLATCDYDLDRSKLETRTIGRHKTSVTFPAGIFNSGIYGLFVGISIPNKVIYDRQDVFQFEMFDSGSFVVNGSGETRRDSIMLMGLKWGT